MNKGSSDKRTADNGQESLSQWLNDRTGTYGELRLEGREADFLIVSVGILESKLHALEELIEAGKTYVLLKQRESGK